MKSRAFFIVGDKFQNFAQGKDVLTVSQLRALSRLPDDLLESHTVLLLGQGTSEDDVAAIARGYNSNFESSARFDVSDLMKVRDRASSEVSHKLYPHNTLIGAPRRTAPDAFELDLILDERCELMGDHQTGQHVQGMLVVEAFRQAFLAVTDTFFPFGDGKRYFVINSMHVDFQNFLFPLPAHIQYRVVESDVNDRRARYKTSLAAIQNGEQCTSASIGFTVYPEQVIAKKEAELAAAVTQKLMAARPSKELPFPNLRKANGEPGLEREM